MIDGIEKNMNKLESIVIDCYSDSDESEQLSKRQQMRLELLKKKRKKRTYKK